MTYRYPVLCARLRFFLGLTLVLHYDQDCIFAINYYNLSFMTQNTSANPKSIKNQIVLEGCQKNYVTANRGQSFHKLTLKKEILRLVFFIYSLHTA